MENLIIFVFASKTGNYIAILSVLIFIIWFCLKQNEKIKRLQIVGKKLLEKEKHIGYLLGELKKRPSLKFRKNLDELFSGRYHSVSFEKEIEYADRKIFILSQYLILDKMGKGENLFELFPMIKKIDTKFLWNCFVNDVTSYSYDSNILYFDIKTMGSHNGFGDNTTTFLVTKKYFSSRIEDLSNFKKILEFIKSTLDEDRSQILFQIIGACVDSDDYTTEHKNLLSEYNKLYFSLIKEELKKFKEEVVKYLEREKQDHQDNLDSMGLIS